jgi:basic amino acid/polyamine antiporter, APA family
MSRTGPAPSSSPPTGTLARRLGTSDAVVVGLGAMIGAGIFAALGPAAEAAGAAMLVSLAIAAVIAWCNATASAELAANSPESGGTYVYGRERLGDWWGYLAGWSFVTGKTASCAAMALAFGAYVAPDLTRPLAVAAVVLLTALNYRGISRTLSATRVILAFVLACLAGVVVSSLFGGTADSANLEPFFDVGPYGVLQGAAILFFAFAGYARIATLGEEVREPARTIRRAVPVALGLAVAVYAAVIASALLAVGPAALAGSAAPLETAVSAGSFDWFSPAVKAGAAIASLGVLLSMIAGVSRTTLAMARRRDLPGYLAAVHPAHRVPHHADIAVALLVCAVVLLTDLRGAISFSAFTILLYYAIANASALKLGPAERTRSRLIFILGLAGCLILAATLPPAAVLAGFGVLAAGIAGRALSLSRRTA